MDFRILGHQYEMDPTTFFMFWLIIIGLVMILNKLIICQKRGRRKSKFLKFFWGRRKKHKFLFILLFIFAYGLTGKFFYYELIYIIVYFSLIIYLRGEHLFRGSSICFKKHFIRMHTLLLNTLFVLNLFIIFTLNALDLKLREFTMFKSLDTIYA